MMSAPMPFANLNGTDIDSLSQTKHLNLISTRVLEGPATSGETPAMGLTGMKVLNAPLSLKCETEVEEEQDGNTEFQEAENLVEASASEDMYRSELPGYSILFYKADTDVTLDSAAVAENSGHGGPSMAQIYSVAPTQGQPSTQVLDTMDQGHVKVGQGSCDNLTNSQPKDAIWLQILSNILARSSENKSISECCPLPADLQPTLPSPMTTHNAPPTFPTMDTSKSDALCPRQGAVLNSDPPMVRVPLTSVTNNKVTRESQASVSKQQKATHFYLLSPVSTSQDALHRAGPPNVHLAPACASYCPSTLTKTVSSQHLSLNSSGEESQMTSPLKSGLPPVPPLGPNFVGEKMEDSPPLLASSPVLGQPAGGRGGAMRESHNMKERRRRARIKDACNLMRQLVPGMSHKTDKATVFEFSARYIHFLKSFVGTNNDKEFLVKYNPY